MAKKDAGLKFKLVVEQDGKDVHSEELHVFALRSLDTGWSNGSFSPELLGYFARYPDVSVSEKAAEAKNVDDSTLELLASSESLEIRRRLIGNDRFRDWVSTETLIKYAKADTEAASDIARSLENFKSVDRSAVAEFFLGHANPYLRYCIVDDYPLPRKALKSTQTSDPDASVRALAKRKLDEA